MVDEQNKSTEEIELELSNLKFKEFGIKDAHTIGLYLVKVAQTKKLAITIDISIGKHQVFHYALEGTNEENDDWIRRKNNVTKHFKRSSYVISRELIEAGENLSDKYGLSDCDYAPFGGSVPIMVYGLGMVGTITVSGLLDHLDHELVISGLKWYLQK